MPVANGELQLLEAQLSRELMKAPHEVDAGARSLVARVDHHPQDGPPVPAHIAVAVHQEAHSHCCVRATQDTECVLTVGHPGKNRVQRPFHGRYRCGCGETDSSARIGHPDPRVQQVGSQPWIERVLRRDGVKGDGQSVLLWPPKAGTYRRRVSLN